MKFLEFVFNDFRGCWDVEHCGSCSWRHTRERVEDGMKEFGLESPVSLDVSWLG